MKNLFESSGISENVVYQILEIAVSCEIEKIIIFGSRARGDYKKTSDIDIAVSGGYIAKFSACIKEDVDTLLDFDIVNLDASVQEELLFEIKKEGKILYEKI